MCLVIILSQFLAVVLRFLTQPGKEQALWPGLASSVLQATALGLSKILPTWLTPKARPRQALDLQNHELLRTSLLSEQKALGRPRLPGSSGREAELWEGRADGMCCPGGRGPDKARGRTQVAGSLGRQGSRPRTTA